ncbi:BQ5605_C002g01056 [Microbotryum silenes-dioicae]|uniref:BQ5605_C002g01056 protein n=1 Tax=Microbotryum silenes-dioicae TaxID=796604 RepID=A0A2X0LXK9_9BASI|nr:BQ5605_C002g01056 [Microbotryum silenes-dioicae]
MYAVEPLQEYELVSQLRVPGWDQIPALWPAPIAEADRALRPALIPEPCVPLPPALPQLPLASPEAESWYAASAKELNSMGLHKVFKLSSPPTGARALGYRWVFTRKEDAEGNIISYMAQLVVQGFAPRLGINYRKTLALVSSITTILFVVRLCAARGLVLTSRRRCLFSIGSLSSALACFLR